MLRFFLSYLQEVPSKNNNWGHNKGFPNKLKHRDNELARVTWIKQMSGLKSAPLKKSTEKILLRLESWYSLTQISSKVKT